jgi:carotenoid cleavage dioxygenase-like enzyme
VKNDLPDDFEQILPRGRIAAITDPSFIPASSADIRDDAWVLGVVIDGQARAFSLNLLNHHEVVNDEIGQTPYAAVW